MARKTAGQQLAGIALPTLAGAPVAIPDATRMTHVQFLRFAGCPVCHLHLRSFINRRDELTAAGVVEVVVFHSTAEELAKYESELPFSAVPDPSKQLYRDFGVEASARALLDPRVWWSIIRGLATAVWNAARGRAPMAPFAPRGGELGLPADLLIAPTGSIVAAKYGAHAGDQWTVDDVLRLTSRWRQPAPNSDNELQSP